MAAQAVITSQNAITTPLELERMERSFQMQWMREDAANVRGEISGIDRGELSVVKVDVVLLRDRAGGE